MIPTYIILCGAILLHGGVKGELTMEEVCAGTIREEYGEPQTDTSFGRVEGKFITTGENFTGLAFFGIPYAEEPSGNLRFAKPIFRKPWKGVFKAKEYGPACPQNSTFSTWHPTHTAEDCLWLGIYAPADSLEPGKKYPVMYYIHGGNWEFDSPQMFPPAMLFQNFVSNGLMIVTVSYRLGGLGFFSTGTADALGNWAFYDMILGLQWIKQEIGNFGGDPSKVTIMGHSSGGMAVSQLTLSPLTKGLFQQAVPMSGSGFTPGTTSQDLSLYESTAERLGCNRFQRWRRSKFEPIIDCLREIPVDKFTDVYLGLERETGLATWPRIDGPGGMFPKSMDELGNARNPVNIMTGTTSNEMAIGQRSDPQPSEQEIQILCFVFGSAYGTNTSGRRAISDACNYHYNEEVRNSVKPTFFNQPLKQFVSDAGMYAPQYKEASLMRKKGGTVYIYSFDYITKQLNDSATFHALDLFYLMGIHCLYRYDDDDIIMRQKYGKYFSNFIIHGNPLPGGDWKKLGTPVGFNYYSVNLKSEPGEFYHFPAVQFWDTIVPYLNKFAGENTEMPKLTRNFWWNAYFSNAAAGGRKTFIASADLLNLADTEKSYDKINTKYKQNGATSLVISLAVAFGVVAVLVSVVYRNKGAKGQKYSRLS